jgi:DNA (cytosine-5)-methyltransferase 1
MKILNLYACLGGNRYKWSDEHKVTAVELDPELARLYKIRFPKDTVIVEDAHEYLLNNYKNFDFIWTSPPCPSHSRARFVNAKSDKTNFKPIFPSMILYEEILFLQHYFKGKFCVENVIPYYEPLIPAQKRGRHLYWCNFLLPQILSNRNGVIMENKNATELWYKFHEIDLSDYKGKQSKQKICRNLVDFVAGNTILETALNIHNGLKTNQLQLL